MKRQKALAILAAGKPAADAPEDDRAAFLTALSKLAAEHVSTADLEAAATAELSALTALDNAREATNAALSSALRS